MVHGILKLVPLIFLLSAPCFADEVFVSYGLGEGPSAANSLLETKTVDLGYRYFLFHGVYWQNKLGFWDDNSGNPQRSSSAYASSSLGAEIDFNPLEIRSSFGLACITNTDSYLGGYFPQFNESLSAGFRDRDGMGLAVVYSHISSAGVYSPNIGRDFLTLEFSFKWW